MSIKSAALISATIMFAAPSAYSYNWITHSQMVEAAVVAMQSAGNDPPADSGISNQDWLEYRNAMRNAIVKLNSLHPSLAGEEIQITQDLLACGYNWERDTQAEKDNYDLSKISVMQIRQLVYYPKRPGDACTLQYIPQTPSPGGPREHILGKVLGWHAAMVDDHKRDTVFGIKPTNAAFLGFVKSVVSDAFIVAVGIVLVPVLCIIGLFSGHGCHARDAINFATKLDPTPYLDSIVPVLGDIEEGDLGLKGITGIWHFMHVGAGLNRYNEIRGMWYPGAGPLGVPGAVDVAIKVAADVTGLTVKYSECNGAKNYGSFDSGFRSADAWQEATIGDIEFSSLQSLAEYGWTNFRKHNLEASWLGWPLHALGDAAEPHHVAGTTAWGHRPFEDAAERYWSELFSVDQNRFGIITPQGAQLDRILIAGYHAWQGIPRKQVQDWSIRQYIADIGTETRNMVVAQSDWPYIDNLSTSYFLGFHETSTIAYHAYVPLMRPLIEHGIGAMVGFLTGAASIIPKSVAVNVKCPQGEIYSGEEVKHCVPLLGQAPPTPLLRPAISVPSLQPAGCLPVNGRCAKDQDCCKGMYCLFGLDRFILDPQHPATLKVDPNYRGFCTVACQNPTSCSEKAPCCAGYYCDGSTCKDIPIH